MATSKILPIAGHRDESVPNRFLRPRDAVNNLAVLLPGFGYTLDMPLFYYAEHLLLERGWDVLRVEYAYNLRPEYRDLGAQQRVQWLLDDVEAAFGAGISQGDYDLVALIGKSLGTLAMGHLLTAETPPPAAMRAVWLTPLIGNERLRERIVRYGGPSLFVIGTADPQFDQIVLDRLLQATNGEAVVVRDADHGMDIPGDPVASVQALAQVVTALAQFL